MTEIAAGPAPKPPKLYELRGVERRYLKGTAQVRALREVDLDIHAGEFVSIEGPSGSGKSTLLQLLGALDTPTSGTVRFEGQDLSRARDRALTDIRCQKIGFIFQQFNLIPTLTAIDNVAIAIPPRRMTKKERRMRAGDLLGRVGLSARLNHLPSRLSGGEQQRVAIARALANAPEVIVADEPTGNLDPATTVGIMRILDRINRTGTTIVMATHDQRIVDAMRRRVVELDHGAMVRDDTRGVYGVGS
jgi:putative ABC transport system ATP-binding protein